MKWTRLIAFNGLGLVVLFSWLLPSRRLWDSWDAGVFWSVNQWITEDHPWVVDTLALLNTRFFDLFSFLVMALLFVAAIRADRRHQRFPHWLSIGVVMLVVAGLLAIFTHDGISFSRASPTRWFDGVNLVTALSAIPTKDSAGNSFPGDHGLMLMVFTAFMWRFSTPRIGALSVLCVVLLSAPRVLVGAHWFSDIYMGALSIALIALPWVLCTPLVAWAVKRVEAGVSRLPLIGAPSVQ